MFVISYFFPPFLFSCFQIGPRTRSGVILASPPTRIGNHLPKSWATNAPPTIPLIGWHVIVPTTRPTVPPTIAFSSPIFSPPFCDVLLRPELGPWVPLHPGSHAFAMIGGERSLVAPPVISVYTIPVTSDQYWHC